MKTVRMLVSGKVQHVGFRACTRKIAVNLGVCGEVANCSDGTVEITATGDAAVLEKFVAMVYGCPRAVIKEVEIETLDRRPFPDFTIVREAGQ
ncbi:acylphosphatase [Methanofollis formosanus]|uniref:acylphosphatase n=1 Tax=Methanofollis formosanus TaxID=299308 RepID=A0A8G1A2T5_9EURY|nr:acylphosphatase [Methanofollis formosanus]QYZ80001.1 acylphosphatase [Methanofollis formosanus]